MTADAVTARPPAALRATRRTRGRGLPLLARRPDLLPIGVALAAWIVAVAPGPGRHVADGTTGASHLRHIASVATMTLAMMSPLAVPLVRTAALTSTWWRARRAVVVSFGAFAYTWVAVGVVLHVVMETVTATLGTPRQLAGAALALFAVALVRPGRAAAVGACMRARPLRARGWAAEGDCLQLGGLAGMRCVRTCALPMLAMVALPGSLPLMAGLTAAGLAERIWAPRGRRLLAGGFAVLGLALLV